MRRASRTGPKKSSMDVGSPSFAACDQLRSESMAAFTEFAVVRAVVDAMSRPAS